MKNLINFINIYEVHLAQAVRDFPEDYDLESQPEGMRTPSDYAYIASSRMMRAIERGTFNKDGRAFRATCKELGIPHTYEAISAYIRGL